MLKVAITGNIASGKSVAETFLRENGFMVYDTDVIAHEILETSKDVREIFKNYDILNNGYPDRKKIGEIVFNDNKKLKELENIIHPLVKEKISEIFKNYKKEKIIFISVPQLFESGFDKMFDKIIFISANEDIRLARIIERNNLSYDEAQCRILSQMNENYKIDKSDFLLYNNTTKDDFIEQLKKLMVNISQIIS